MIRPAHFGYNEETADSNAFQDRAVAASDLQNLALQEFDRMANGLQKLGVEVLIYDDTLEGVSPDAIFPNNWFSTDASGAICLFPMQAVSRRGERRGDIVDDLRRRFKFKNLIDLTNFEHQNKFLEGTGSLVLDRENKTAYAAVSPRTNDAVLSAFAEATNYKIVKFHAVDADGQAIYHTNVLMCVGEKFAVICDDSIKKQSERKTVVESLRKKEIIRISFEQMADFAGNMLELRTNGRNLLVMSQRAFSSLTHEQKQKLESYTEIAAFDLTIIERAGGGSARCMMAEIFAPVS